MLNFRNFKFPHNKLKGSSSNVAANTCLVNYIHMALGSIGADVLSSDYTMGFKVYTLIFVTHTFVVSFVIMTFDDDVALNLKLEAMCLCFVAFHGICKMYAGLLLQKFYAEITKIIENLHLQYVEDSVIAPALKNLCWYCMILSELLSLTFYFATLAYFALPIFMWKKFGILTTIYPITFPCIDWHKPAGYIINSINHLYVGTAGPAGILCVDVLFMYFVLHSIGYVDIMKDRLDKLDSLLESGSNDLEKIKTQLCSCIKAHQDYIFYVDKISDAFSVLCFTQLATGECILTLALFLSLWSKWIIGPFMVMCAIFQLLEYCILGTIITIQNKRVQNIIYNMKWYLLPVKEQKVIVFMLLRAQSSPEMSVGSFAKLNVETGMQVLKTTYSYLMMMLKFIR